MNNPESQFKFTNQNKPFNIIFTDNETPESYKITFKKSTDIIKLGKYFSKLMDEIGIEHEVEYSSKDTTTESTM